MIKKVTYVTIFTFILFFLFQCNSSTDNSNDGGDGSDGDDEDKVTVLSTWTGNFTYDNNAGKNGTGQITSWKLMSDNTTSGTWISDDGSLSITSNGTYTLSGTNLTFTGSGAAVNNLIHESSNFTIINGIGTLDVNAGTGSGTNEIVFTEWGPYDCTWDITKQ